MGQIADAIINGEQCSLCGCCFEKEHGFPVVCYECWEDLNDDERGEYQRATQETL